jgi:hypothetical protein
MARPKLIGVDEDLLGLAFPQGEIVTADFDFHRIAQRGEANKFDFGADQQTHFHQARAAGRRDFDFRDSGNDAFGNESEWL